MSNITIEHGEPIPKYEFELRRGDEDFDNRMSLDYVREKQRARVNKIRDQSTNRTAELERLDDAREEGNVKQVLIDVMVDKIDLENATPHDVLSLKERVGSIVAGKAPALIEAAFHLALGVSTVKMNDDGTKVTMYKKAPDLNAIKFLMLYATGDPVPVQKQTIEEDGKVVIYLPENKRHANSLE